MSTTTRAPRVVDALVTAGLLDPARRDEASGVVARTLAEPDPRRTSSKSLLVEIAGYVGGALVVASVALFLAQQWAQFSEAAQVTVLAVITLVLAVAGFGVAAVSGGHAAMRSGEDEVRRRLSSALLVASALAAGFTAARVVDLAITEQWTEWPGFAGALTMLVLAVPAYVYAPSVLGQLALAGAAFTAAMSGWALAADSSDGSVVQGVTVMLLGVVWVVVAEARLWQEVVPGRAIGMALALVGAQMMLFDGSYDAIAYAATALVAAAGFALYLRTVGWPYLVAGVLAVTLVVPEAVMDWTGDSLGPAGAVLVAGLTLLAASLTGFRLRQEATR